MSDVLGLPIPDGYEIIFLLTLILITVKLSMAIYLAFKLKRHREVNVASASQFVGSVLFLMACWAISRIFFMIFDFFLTDFVEATYPNYPNIWFWKFGSIFASIGVILVMWVVDKKILSNKFKGLFAIFMAIALIIQTAYPVSTFDDFIIASTIGVIGALSAFLIPILFLYIGGKTPGLRKMAFTFAFGIIIYIVGGSMVSAAIIPIFYAAGLSQTLVYLFSTSMKIIGLLMITRGATRFQV